MFFYQSPTGDYFNNVWYKNNYDLNHIPDNQLMTHYETIGAKLNYNPSLYFNTKWYKETYKLFNDENPIKHFLNNVKTCRPNEKCKYLVSSNFKSEFINIRGDFVPLTNEPKRYNLILPGISFSAGPMTIIHFANLLAKNGYLVRIISMYNNDIDQFKQITHKINNFNENIQYETMVNNHVKISYDDVFIASAWWTIYPLKFILGYLKNKHFFWFIQENELILHKGDSNYNYAMETYKMDYYSFVNTSLLLDGLIDINFSHFSNDEYLKKCCVCFEPAFNSKLFKYVEKKANRKIKIIFYSRSHAERNLQNLIYDSLRTCFMNGIVDETNYEIIGFGHGVGKYKIDDNFYVNEVGFLNEEDYAKLFRDSDILISFVLSTHPGYAPLEMSYCNGVCIHNNYNFKNNDSINRYSDKILMCEPNVISIVEKIIEAIDIIKTNSIMNIPPKLLNEEWDVALTECFNFLKTHELK